MGYSDYLKEVEDHLEELEDSIEEPEDYDIDQPLGAEYIAVKDPVDMSDEVQCSDKYMYSNSEPMSYYAKGNGFDLEDNGELYEVIKAIHELTDKHFYVRDLTWKANIKHRFVEFIFKLGEGDDETDKFFLDGVYSYFVSEITKQFGPTYDFDKEPFVDSNGKHSVKITVKRISED